MSLPPPRPGLSIVIPVYNAALTLSELVAQLGQTLPALTEAYEIILVNDGSRDTSWETIRGLASEQSFVRGIDLMRNYGQHNALLCGIRAARHAVVVTMDDDLQHPPSELPKLLAKLGEGHDVVYGTPLDEQQQLWRNIASQVTKIALQSAMGARTARHVSAFRVFRTTVRQAFADYTGPYVALDVLLTWATTRFAAIPVRHDPRRRGTSNYTFRKLIAHAINMMTGYSTLPLELASFLGFSLTAFGVAVLVYVVGRYVLEGGSPPGFAFLASVTAIFSGAQLFALGIIGEYLARMHFRSMGHPVSTVRQSVGFDEHPDRGAL